MRLRLDSIVSQTFRDWECILIDDGSPDNSGAICDEYAAKDARFRVIHQTNAGVSAARNAGLDAARGEWIGFVDSDDWIEAETLDALLAESKGKEFVVGGMKYSGGTSFYEFPLDANATPQAEWGAQIEQSFHSACGKLFRREIIDGAALRFLRGVKYGEDTIFSFMYLANVHSVHFVAKKLYTYFNERETSAVHNLEVKDVETMRSNVADLEKYIAEKGRLDDFASLLPCLKVFVKTYFLWAMKKPDFAGFRRAFPEVNGKIYEVNTFLSLFSKMYIWLILHKIDFLAWIMFAAKEILKKIS